MILRLSDWATTLLWNLNCLSRQKCLMTLVELKWRTEDYTGFKSPEEGMLKAFRMINAALHAKEEENWFVDDFPYSYLWTEDDPSVTIVYNEDSSPFNLDSVGAGRGKGRKSARSRQRKRQREQKASSSTAVPVHQCSDASQNAALKMWIDEFERMDC